MIHMHHSNRDTYTSLCSPSILNIAHLCYIFLSYMFTCDRNCSRSIIYSHQDQCQVTGHQDIKHPFQLQACRLPLVLRHELSLTMNFTTLADSAMKFHQSTRMILVHVGFEVSTCLIVHLLDPRLMECLQLVVVAPNGVSLYGFW